MAFDGIFLSLLKNELSNQLLQGRVEKIHQPSKEEIVIHFRTRGGLKKLLLCAKADSARIQLTDYAPENPASPTMLCMLLRKRLSGARLTDIRQNELERVLFLDFDGTDELGDKSHFSLIIEIMARHSNIILVNSSGVIVDSVKRVDFTKSSVRQILPGLPYALPPAQNKLNVFTESPDVIANAVISCEKQLAKAVSLTVQGLSPILCREIASMCCGDDQIASFADKENLKAALSNLKNCAENAVPVVIVGSDASNIDFTFMPVRQYGSLIEMKEYDSFSHLLDEYYYRRESSMRIRQRSHDLFKQLNILLERSVRKGAAQKEQLRECDEKEKYKIFGDLISSNLYRLEKGSLFYDLENYYETPASVVRIPAVPSMTPNENAQKYYKEYRKLQTAQKMLVDFIEQTASETDYLESVIDELSRAATEKEISAVKEELYAGGYLRNRNKTMNSKKSKPLPPRLFTSKDGFEIRIGRNNIQNDRLTLKEAGNYDLWLHVKDSPGSHVIISSTGDDFSEQAVYDGAMLAAYFSKKSESSGVAVDYAIVKNVKKTSGAKPGRVIYTNYKTIYVTPSKEYVDSICENGVKE